VNKDQVLLTEFKKQLWWFMSQQQQTVWQQYYSMVTKQNYSLSKKNLANLEKIIHNINTRRQQAINSNFQGNDLFE
jgi:predicted solute-binding protein